jgi:hypothetical protein
MERRRDEESCEEKDLIVSGSGVRFDVLNGLLLFLLGHNEDLLAATATDFLSPRVIGNLQYAAAVKVRAENCDCHVRTRFSKNFGQ